jgi:hypothetical protein
MKTTRTEAPTTNIQAPEKHQARSTKDLNVTPSDFGAWSLELLWGLALGCWSFNRSIDAGVS